jgi:hypothetical protein
MHGRGRLRTTRARTLLSIAAALALAIAALSSGVAANASGSEPTAVVEAPSAIGLTTATLAGTVNPHGSQVTECIFRYGTSPVPNHSVSCSYSPGHGVTPVAVEAAVSGLAESTTYYVELFAKNANGESLSEQRQFTTLPTAPHSNSGAPHNVTRHSATMDGFVTPNGSEVTECFFEYGPEPSSMPNHAPCSPSPGSGTEPVAVSAQLEGLAESSQVYYRLVSKNAFGSDSGMREHIWVLPNQPNANGEPANPVGRTTATLQGVVDPRESLVEQCYFKWGAVSVSEHTTPCSSSPGAGNEFVRVSAELEGLSESTTYFYRVVATNVFGENESGQRNFTTEPTVPRVQLRKTNEVAARSALLKGVVDPESTSITGCEFEFGTTPALGQSAPCNLLPAGEGFQKVQARLTGLSPATKYFYRLAATNSFGTEYSGEESITTFEPGLLPVVTKLSPKKGLAIGGTSVTIKGKNLGEAISVSFGGTESEHVTVNSTESVTAVAPPGAGVVDVTVTSVDGTSELSSGDHYTYGTASIVEISPNTGPAAGGNEVTITGNGFLPGVGQTGFVFAKAPATNVVCESLNKCTMTVPAEPKGKAKTVKVQAIVIGKKSPHSPGAVYSYTP